MLHVRKLLLESACYLAPPKAALRCMTAWRKMNEGCFWAVKPHVKDLRRLLDVTLRAVAWYFWVAEYVSPQPLRSLLSGPSPWGFQRMLWKVRSKCLSGGLHGS